MAGWQRGDQQAARELYQLYAGRLIELARGRLSGKLAARVDAEDVVQSAYRSFFCGARDGLYHLERGDDLWLLLVGITLNKVRLRVRSHAAQKRAVEREQHFGSEDSLLGLQAFVASREPSPLEAVALTDALEQLMRHLDPLDRRMLELRLQGYNLDEIASATDRSERTVIRTLEEIKLRLRQWHNEAGS
jgi:RNA polymerase sigma-70 factor, ECF subfamily